jgi:hypothetical protein
MKFYVDDNLVPFIRHWERVIFLLFVFTLPLEHVTKRFTISALGDNLSQYFLIVGGILYLFEFFKYKFKVPKYLVSFIVIYTLWQLFCLAIGLIYYQYPQYLAIDPSSKIAAIEAILINKGIIIDSLILNKLWQFLRFSRGIVFAGNTVFFVILMILHLYGKNYKMAFQDIRKAILCMVIVMCLYSIFELLWLKFHVNWAKSFLVSINPFLYDVASTNHWWPPLLWKGQLRSITAEPSFFGYYAVFYLPFLWSYFFEDKIKVKYIVLLTFFSLMIAATNARTAIILTVFECTIFICSALLVHTKMYIKRVALVILVMTIGFSVNLINPVGIKTSGSGEDSSIEAYIAQNVVSVSKKDSRSNSARLANLISYVMVALDYPITGVGQGLTSAYVDARLPEFSYTNNEVRNWSRDMHLKGVLKSGFPALNIYAYIAASSGFVGLILYLAPYLYVFLTSFKLSSILSKDSSFLLIFGCLLTLMAAGFSNSFNGGTAGIILGLIFTKFYSYQEMSKKI